MKRMLALLGLAIIVLPALPPAQAGFGGYIYRFNVNPQYMNNEDVIVQVVAFRSSADNKVIEEAVHLTFLLAKEINGKVGNESEILNMTITGSAKPRKINLGRMDLGTWHITCKYEFADGEVRKLSHSFLVSHVPIKYALVFLNNGRIIDFRSLEKNRTFSLEVWANYGRSTEMLCAYHNITNKTIRINPKHMISVTAFVTDEYNWTNAMEDIDHTYIYTVSQMDEYIKYVIVLIAWVVAISIIIYIRRRWV